MKRCIFGDLHGHYDSFFKLYAKEEPDEVILLGDYLDSFTINSQGCANCLNSILKLKEDHEKHSGKFIILLGNHELHYVLPGEYYSGHKLETQGLVYKVLSESILNGTIQPIYFEDNTIYSHAGITNTWMDNNGLESLEEVNKVESILDLGKFRFTGFNRYGDSVESGPMWVRPKSLTKDHYQNYTQIVGHTPMKQSMQIDNLYFIDCMPRQYIIETIEDGKCIERQIAKSND